MNNKFLVSIVGSGPVAMMAAVRLVDNKINNIAIFEKGSFDENHVETSITSQWGGSGSKSDSKLNLTHKVGGTLHELIGLNKYYKYLKEQEEIWLRFKPTQEQISKRINHKPDADIESRYFEPNENVYKLRTQSLKNNLELDTYTTLHLGTDNMQDICLNIYEFLKNNGVSIFMETEIIDIKKENNLFKIYSRNSEYISKNVIVSPGRAGGNFVKKIANNFNLSLKNNGLDVGVRVEMPQEIGYLLGKEYSIYEPKWWGYKGRWNTKVRTFCYCPKNAFVAMEEYRQTGIQCVNGHSFSSDGHSSGNLNFSVLATEYLTEPCTDSLGYIENIAKQVNIAGNGGPLVQRFIDLKNGHRSTKKKIMQGATVPSLECEAGDLGLVMPARQLDAIIEFIDDLGKIIPGMSSDYILLYAPEVKFYSNKVVLNSDGTTEIKGLFFGGDSSGYCRGLNMSSIHGLLIADAILDQ